jgi:hypothetical protein
MNNVRSSGRVQISDDDLLYRRFHYTALRPDGSIVGAAYTKPKSAIADPEISVDLARLTSPEKTLKAGRLPVFGLGELKVGDVRKLGFTVRSQPIEENPAHCIIEGVKTEEDCDRLAEITRVHTRPPRKSNA